MRRDPFIHNKNSILAIIFAVACVAAAGAAVQASGQAQSVIPSAPAGGVDPSKLPEIEGIHLGMPAQDALAKIKLMFPPNQLDMRYVKFQNAPDAMWVSQAISGGNGTGCKSPCSDQLTVWFSTPPNKQVVIAIGRQVVYEIGKQPAMAGMMDSLRKQYGQELPKGAIPNAVSGMSWVYDESGKLLPVSTPKIQPGCAGNIQDFPGGGPNPNSPNRVSTLLPLFTGNAADMNRIAINPCRSHVYVLADMAPASNATLLGILRLSMSENAEDTRDVYAGQMYLNGLVKKK